MTQLIQIVQFISIIQSVQISVKYQNVCRQKNGCLGYPILVPFSPSGGWHRVGRVGISGTRREQFNGTNIIENGLWHGEL